MLQSAINRRRDDLDRSLHGLRTALMVADPTHAAFRAERPYPLTPDYARLYVVAAHECAAKLESDAKESSGPAVGLAVCLASVLTSHAQFVKSDADSLDRAIRAASDRPDDAADGASLVVAA